MKVYTLEVNVYVDEELDDTELHMAICNALMETEGLLSTEVTTLSVTNREQEDV